MEADDPNAPELVPQVTLALAEKLSALMTEDYLVSRAEQGNLNKFQAALSKVSSAEPEE